MRPALVNGLLLLHDNGQPHVSQIVFQKLNELQIGALPHPLYSSDLSPTDYHLSKHLDNFLKNRAFKGQGDVEAAFLEFISELLSEWDGQTRTTLARMCRIEWGLL
ncbi:hypothetical protein V3C99_012440 [Haemonchus contortus]|uniref:Histone-lysine N-methyltransferase SETMAR n=1 Tax=Haemonchus contortus TaxID=6289 RepID=A0A7I4Y3I5_HAECO